MVTGSLTDREQNPPVTNKDPMAGNGWFEFKQFRIEQQRAAMKVGTDGVLLGAWTHVEDARRIVDVGTGTGLIALMLAQRSSATIEAIEIESEACAEAKFNFEQSPWSNRLTVINTDFLVFSELHRESYDVVVSNPPFFINSLKSDNKSLAIARHDHMLTFGQLIIGTRKLLRHNGKLFVIIPYESFLEFRELARLSEFYLGFRMNIIPRIGKTPKRVMLGFTLVPGFPVESELSILDENGLYTEKYKALTAPYYPAF